MGSGTAPTYGLERGALNGFVAGLYNLYILLHYITFKLYFNCALSNRHVLVKTTVGINNSYKQ